MTMFYSVMRRAALSAVLISTSLLSPAYAEDAVESAEAPVVAAGEEAAQEQEIALERKHAFSLFKDPEYPADFPHFDYVNPEAPKGGTLRLADVGTFDSLNPFILKGIADPRAGLQFDTLTVSSDDEIATAYGLLAESIAVAPDNSFAEFVLREEARFADGKPVTAEDAVYSFKLLTEEGAPHYRTYYGEVEKAEAIDERTVRFTFANPENRELPLIIGQLQILPKHFLEDKDFAAFTEEPMPGSGPYKIEKTDMGRRLVLKRREDYWAKDLPVNVGKYNFDTITADYYRDTNVAVEALKAGEYDFRKENIAKNWATAYDIDKVKNGDLVKELLPDGRPTGMQSFVLNTRKTKFADAKTREALAQLLDFEWINKHLFFNAYARNRSYFANSPYEAKGLPEGDELALLEQYREQLPERLFTEEFTVPVTDGSGNNRAQLRKARELLLEAGWTFKDGKWLHKDGKTVLEAEFLLILQRFERVVAPMIKSMEKLGIPAKVRTLDTPQYVNRLENFDFDIVSYWFTQSAAPGNEQLNFWHSSTADVKGSKNFAGIKDPVVDALTEKLLAAESFAELQTATMALDRVLQWRFYTIPHWNSRSHRLIYDKKLGRPEITPPYGFDYISTWWVKP